MGSRCVYTRIHGRVQGVCFREYTRRRAVELGLGGWVRNRQDGSVEALIRGESSSVEAMLDWLRTGSPAARVDRVDCREALEEPTESGFCIRY